MQRCRIFHGTEELWTAFVNIVLRKKSYALNVRKEHNSNTLNCTNLRRGKMYDDI
jgi:hypothetical protein